MDGGRSTRTTYKLEHELAFFLSELRARGRYVIGPLVGILATAYFGFHAIQGDRGLLAWWRLRAEVAEARTRDTDVAERHRVLEHRVYLLGSHHLDPDLLEERARAMLGYGRANDIVILVSDLDML